ncbi:MAG: iron-containing alcohol dehydrogenase [Clostridiales bacterium]|nr:iron-containing alcohol dehydrogenase [Clostridiales bacterium]
MNDFIYNTPTKVYFGKGKEKEIGEIIREYGYKKIMLQYGKASVIKSGLLDTIKASLNNSAIEFVEMGGVEPNPKITFVREAIAVAKREKVDMILAVGGGSVIDSCKYTALGAKADCDVWDFAMGKRKPIDAIPVACVLTHSAAGSEMSNSAVITNLELNMKKGCSTELNRLKFAVMNPELTYTLPAYQTACGVVDIMAHTMERYFTVCDDTDLTDRIAESILKAVISAGRVAVETPNDYEARATIMWASSLSHNGLTGCGRENYLAVHQLEHALSGEYDHVAHGAGLAVLFPAWAKYVYKTNVKRFAQFARRVWDIVESDDEKAAIMGIEAMSNYFKSIGMPTTLKEFNIPNVAERLADLCTYQKTRTVKSYITLDYKVIKEIFESCY